MFNSRKLFFALLQAVLLAGMLFGVPRGAAAQLLARPIANDDSGPGFITDQYTAFTLADVLANDADPEGDPLSIASFDISATAGLVTYVPPGPAGTLDPTFDGDGKVTTDFFNGHENAHALVRQPDGKLVAAGYLQGDADFALARYNLDGSLDTSFDGDGRLTTDFFGASDLASALVVQPDGKIVAVGYTGIGAGSNYNFALARYNSDGSLDTSFDGDGMVTTDLFGNQDEAYALALQPDGKLVAAGWASNGGSYDFALARYNPDGSLDTSFDGDGKVATNFTAIDNAYALVVQPDGKIVAAGFAWDGVNYEFALARYNPNGSLDTSFDGDGKLMTDFFGNNDSISALVLQPDGKLVAAGRADNGGTYDFALARYNPDGSLDTSFDGDGKLTTDFSGGVDSASALVLQPDGKLVAVGNTRNGSVYDFVLVRYNPDGSLDASFDGDGMVTTNFGGLDFSSALILQPDGNLVVAGYVSIGTSYDFALARYEGGRSSGNFTYNPNNQFEWLATGEVATDTFTYVASDGVLTDTATVSITINGVNDVPVANDDSGPGFTTDEDTTFTLASVLANDGDANNNTLFVDNFDAGVTAGLVTFVPPDPVGALDASFDGDGRITTNFIGGNDVAYALALQPDGKLVAAGVAGGNFALVRYNSDGGLDASFDGDGKVITDLGSNDIARALVMQPDGKIVVAGASGNGSNDDFVLARYNPDGSLDASFDSDGWVTTDFLGGVDIAYALALQPDGKLVAAGRANNGGSYEFALARYNPDGSLDSSFDGDGKLTSNIFSSDDTIYALVVQPDNKIVAAGSSSYNLSYNFALARYNSDGSLDTSFDCDGKVTTDFFGQTDTARALALQPDGKIVAAGYAYGSNYDFALARYHPNGLLDTSFDGDGKVTTAFFGSDDFAYALTLQPDGDLVAAGAARNGSNNDFALARYRSNGSLDTSFDGDGRVTTAFLGNFDYAYAMILQPDGKLVAAGYTYENGYAFGYDFALARYADGGGGSFGYDPNGQFEWLAAGEVVTDTFTYIVSDGSLTDTTTVSVTITGINDAPVLTEIGGQWISETVLLAFSVSASDLEQDILAFSLDPGAPQGAAITPGGDFTWTPTELQGPGVYTVTVRVTDDGSPTLSDSEIITITVSEVNLAPVLDPVGNQSIPEGSLLVFAVIASDSDIPANALTFSLDAGAPAGASITPGGDFTWMPTESQGPGVYPVTVRVTDDGIPALDDFETIQITVGEVNQAPVAVDDAYITDEDTPLVVSAPGMLDNDSDPDLPPNTLSAALDTPPAIGELALAGDGSFVYTPTLNFNGLVTFTYHANDGLVSSNLALVSITVAPVNDAPVAEGQAFNTAEDTAYSGALAGSDVDGDLLTFSLDTAPAYGSVAIAADGNFTYTPTLDYNGPDSFTFAVSDGSLSDLGQVSITVDPVNDAPLPDAGTDVDATEGELAQFSGSYADPGLQTLRALETLRVSAVEITWDFGDGVTATGTLTPSHAYADDGAYTVTLTVDDGEGGVASDTLLVTVDNIAPDLAPIADQSVIAGLILTVTASYADPGQLDTQTAMIAWGDGLSETLYLDAGLTSFEFAHAFDTAGVYTVTVTLTDDDDGQDTQILTVEVEPASFNTWLPVVLKR